jgi:GntR family transcriptional regulator of vanillate catabolism
MPRGDVAGSQRTKATLGLRELIFAGELAPDERVPEVGLAERLGVSRTPLRLALATLAHEGLLRALPGGGFVVCSFSLSDVADAIELRGVLEGTAARFAAERRPPRRRLDRLRAVNDEIGTVVHEAEPSFDGFVRYVALNERFHEQLVDLAGSEVVSRALEGVVALPFASASAGLVAAQAQLRESREILVIAHSQHAALIDAIARGEGTRAEAVAREHARMARLNLDVVLRHREMLDRAPGGPLVVGTTPG